MSRCRRGARRPWLSERSWRPGSSGVSRLLASSRIASTSWRPKGPGAGRSSGKERRSSSSSGHCKSRSRPRPPGRRARSRPPRRPVPPMPASRSSWRARTPPAPRSTWVPRGGCSRTNANLARAQTPSARPTIFQELLDKIANEKRALQKELEQVHKRAEKEKEDIMLALAAEQRRAVSAEEAHRSSEELHSRLSRERSRADKAEREAGQLRDQCGRLEKASALPLLSALCCCCCCWRWWWLPPAAAAVPCRLTRVLLFPGCRTCTRGRPS